LPAVFLFWRFGLTLVLCIIFGTFLNFRIAKILGRRAIYGTAFCLKKVWCYNHKVRYIWYCYLNFSGTPLDSWMSFKPDSIHVPLDDSLGLQPDLSCQLTFAKLSEYLYNVHD
jgi:hypothetical protein